MKGATSLANGGLYIFEVEVLFVIEYRVSAVASNVDDRVIAPAVYVVVLFTRPKLSKFDSLKLTLQNARVFILLDMPLKFVAFDNVAVSGNVYVEGV